MVWMFVSLWDSYIKILMPNVMILAYMAFRRRLGYEGGGFMNEISGLIKGTTQTPWPPSPCEMQLENSYLWTRKQASLDTESAAQMC